MIGGAILGIRTTICSFKMIARLNGVNPPDRQYDMWGWPVGGPDRFALGNRRFWGEYIEKFGRDALVRRADGEIAVGLVVLVPCAFVFAFGWPF